MISIGIKFYPLIEHTVDVISLATALEFVTTGREFYFLSMMICKKSPSLALHILQQNISTESTLFFDKITSSETFLDVFE